MPPTPAPLGLLCPRAAQSRAAGGARGPGPLPTNEGIARATVLVADLRGFTGISRRLGAAATAAFLNRLFAAIVPCIEAEAGSIDKFIGDAVLAVFGLPFAGGDEADRAVRAAIAIQRTIADLNRATSHAAGTTIAIAIGIDAGEVFFGCIGAAPYAAPTVIGSSVNTAFALQEACKPSCAGILISAAVRHHLAGRYCLRLVEAPGGIRPTPDETGQDGDRGAAPVYEVLDYQS
jgi:adenylate cyclase